MKNGSVIKNYGYLWATGILFLISLIGHWSASWYTYQKEQQEHGNSIQVNDFVIKTTRDTLENWQSEFLQLMWQVAGLSFLWYLGSPQSKEGDDRKEAKIDQILRFVAKKDAKKIIAKIEAEYPKK